MDGILNIFKNRGLSSFDVVRKVKKVSRQKKVGHTGTLDPEAEGVLPVTMGKATKLIDYIMSSSKTYFVKFQLGLVTTTYDLEGEVLKETSIEGLTEEKVLEVIESFKGEYSQVPPMYSALKQNGVRLYELARKGIEVEREGRLVNIIEIKDINVELPFISMEVKCSKGTYIRSLCYDIGEKLNVGGTMVYLKRTHTASFYEKDSINIEDLNEENIQDNLISIEEALKDYEKFNVNEHYGKLLQNGVNVMDNRIYNDNKVEENKLYRVYINDNIFLGLGKKEGKAFKIEKLLL
ncbi:MAG: tRNA pseudouridine(55) synthase TruB [Clostridium sp.]